MAFYVVFPLLFNFVRGLVAKGVYRLVVFICCIVLFNFSLQMFFLVDTQFEISNNSFFYFNLMNQLPVFLVGFVAFYVANPNEKLAPAHVSIFFFLLVTAASLFFWKQKNPLYFALIPTVSAFSFLFLLNALRGVCFGQSIILRVGQLSFSMYIFHFLLTWGLLPFFVAQFKNALAPEFLLIICFMIVCALTYAIAVLTQKRIELRGIEFGNSIIRRFNSV
jgi:peptidoglycan/LPS O-acetylase OafA/YrhL